MLPSPIWNRFRHACMPALLVLLVTPRAWACSSCLCGSPTPAGLLLSPAPGGFICAVEDRILSKSNALDDGTGSESQVEHRLAVVVLAQLPIARELHGIQHEDPTARLNLTWQR